MRVGLTGGVASGKSTVSAMLAELGAVVIDADLLAREVVAPRHRRAGRDRRGVRARRAHRGRRPGPAGHGRDRVRRPRAPEGTRGDHPSPGTPAGQGDRGRGGGGRAGGARHPAAGRDRPGRELRRGDRGRRADRGPGRADDDAARDDPRGGRVARGGPGDPRPAARDRDARRRQHRDARRPPRACRGGRRGSGPSRREPACAIPGSRRPVVRRRGRGLPACAASAAPPARAGAPARRRCRA